MNIFGRLLASAVIALAPLSAGALEPFIEVTGSATVNIVPDCITIEIGMEEYYKPSAGGDSTIVRLSEIEKSVRRTLKSSGVADSQVVVADMGNYRDRGVSDRIMMAKRLSATVSDFAQIERISESLERRGITSFNITRIDNTDIERSNRQGLKAALDAARDKAEFIAANEGLSLAMILEIVENGPNYYETPSFSNVSFDSGAGMENMRRIVRRYSVRVRYIITKKNTDDCTD
ncbi:MAG: SIMPL domain-containing protein [Muribaculaceae bacterium]|nr:SIMPL domain-containing protein [Muribaculaceae bacterium]